MLEVTPEDIARLSDADLRTLVGMLCEAELAKRDLPVSAVTWGGNQTAADGGLDVRVALPSVSIIEGFVPRASTGFQAKKQDMPAAAITAEMCPAGALRGVIKQLADDHGAYIIVSSEGSTSDSSLQRRRTAMFDALGDLPNASQLHLDFYDRTRMATWVRSHPGIAVWVRSAIGRALNGWQAFGAWAYPAGGTEAEFLIDEGIRICSRPAQSDGDLDARNGLSRIRNLLKDERKIVRLVGLSGVGKTRLVQALFDRRVGADCLDPALAIYTNMNDSPEPQPYSFASDLIANRRRAILVIDNCAPDLHRRLNELATQPSSKLSVLTVEYDIRDDQPEDTEVFELKVASADLIEMLLRERFPSLSQTDARTAAELAGGNARIAIALAQTVGRSGSLAGLGDEDVFKRLFVQRQEEDKSLLEIAQACSLVYSFNGKDLSENGELHQLGSMIGATSDQLFRATSDLLGRDLAQRRGVWRAILPHAIANRLAAVALRRIPIDLINDALVTNASERLVKSFARRLGYLHASLEARAIVEEWFQQGLLADVWNLNEFGRSLFSSVLPVSPEAGLVAIERGAPSRDGGHKLFGYGYLSGALRAIAYDDRLFERCVAQLKRLALGGEEVVAKDASKTLTSLFHLYLSGTHAPIELRISVTKRLLEAADDRERTLGIGAYQALLEAAHFGGVADFQFGARSRDYGFYPKTVEDVRRWYDCALALLIEFAGNAVAADMRAAFAHKLRGLWAQALLRDVIEETALRVVANGFWREGWVAVKQTRYFDAKDTDSDSFQRLCALERALRPADLVQQVRGRVLTSRAGGYDIDDLDETDGDQKDYQVAFDRQIERARDLGEAVAIDVAALEELLPSLLSDEGHQWAFGEGLARGTAEPEALWCLMCACLLKISFEQRNLNLLRGFLHALQQTNSSLAQKFLDLAVVEEPCASQFPALQMAVPLDRRAIDRLIRSIELGKAPTWTFENLALGGVTKNLAGRDLAELLMKLGAAPNGLSAALRILHMRFFGDRDAKREYALDLLKIGRHLLGQVRFRKGRSRDEHDVCEVAEICLADSSAEAVANAVCLNIQAAVEAYETYGFDHSDLIACLLKVQPKVTLTSFLGRDEDTVRRGVQIFDDACHHHPNPMDVVETELLLCWCREEPAKRFPAAAAVITLSKPGTNSLTPVAQRLVDDSPDSTAVVRELARRCRPMSWSGSLSALIEANVRLLDQIETRGDGALAAFISGEKARLLEEAAASLRWETRHDRNQDETFE